MGKLLVGTEARVFHTDLYVSQTGGLFSFLFNMDFLYGSTLCFILSFSSEPLVKVEDLESRQLVEPGQPGELLIKGPQV